ncbi:MAG: hypothetical protein AAF085_11785 [Planctomycetota bacterium]
MNKRAGWSTKQIKLSHSACRAAGIDDNSRHLLLYQLGGKAIVDGCATSTSPKLGHADFEKFMSMIEDLSGGQVLSFARGYWEDKFCNGKYGRLLHRARQLSYQLQDAGDAPMKYVGKAVGRDFSDQLFNLDEVELHKAIDAMTAVIKRKGAA